MSEARFPAEIVGTAVVPWTADWQLDERLFRRQVEWKLADGYRHLYIFGTAGEGYAVSDEQFLQISRVFAKAMREAGAEPMVGVINLSLSTILTRIAAARDLGVRRFQISLPSWGALDDSELFTFFEAVLGRFPDCAFLHYNLPRTKRLVTPDEYAKLAAAFPNLVATKNPTDSMTRLHDLVTKSPQLMHCLGETGFVYGSLVGECGLLISSATTNTRSAREFFAAGRAKDASTLVRFGGELHQVSAALLEACGGANLIDGAYDKVLWKLHDPDFPLRLLPPYRTAAPDAADKLTAYLRANLPHWAPEAVGGRR